jgi:hypothetical protein
MKHVLIVNDETQQGKLVMELINAIQPSDDAIHFVDEEENEELIPAEVAFDKFEKALKEEYAKRGK